MLSNTPQFPPLETTATKYCPFNKYLLRAYNMPASGNAPGSETEIFPAITELARNWDD